MRFFALFTLLSLAGAAMLQANPGENLRESIASAKKIPKPIFIYVYDSI